MDIVLLQLPFWGIDCPPLGLALLKSYLSDNNISCKVFDININAYSLRGEKYNEYWEIKHGYNFSRDKEEMLKYYIDNRALFLYYMNEIKKLNPKIVGCSCQNSSFILSQIFLEDLRNNLPHFKHILGGPEVAGFMRNADELLEKDYIDAINLGEGEMSLVNYFHSVEKNEDKPIEGIIYKKNGRIIKGGSDSFVKNLNELPFPDFSDFDLKHYYDPFKLPSYTSRSCVNRCIYCTARNYLKPFRFRSAKRIFDEIKFLKQQYPNINYIRMFDDISNSNIKELEIFCDLMINANLGIKWNLENAVIRKEMKTPLYKKLKQAGCALIGYGVETPSKKLLAAVGKDLSKDVDIAQVLREGKREGIYISINVMFGLPGESEEDFLDLLEFLKKNRRSINMVIPSFNFCEFYPGSDGYENPEKYDLDISNGHLFWQSKDGTNTYLVRLRRFEFFCKMAQKYRLDNIYNSQELPNKHKLLFKYYFVNQLPDKALKEYSQIPANECTNELNRMHKAIKDGSFVVNLNEEAKRLFSILIYGKTFEETFILASLTERLDDLGKVDIFENAWLKSWQRKLRYFAHRLIGYDRIDKKINSIYSILKIVDEKIQCFSKNKKDNQ